MAQQFEKVRPGDLIKSDFFNRVIDALESLEGRVDKLETVCTGGGTTGKVVITEPNSSQTFHLGDPLKIIGKNFGLPSQNVVTIEEKIIDTFETGSGDQLLIIAKIPNVQNIPQNGRMVTLHLSNAIGNAETTFTLAQPATTKPTGTLKTNLSSTIPPTEPVEASKNPVYTYTISAIVTMPDSYLIEPKVDLGWKAELVDSQGNPINPAEVKIEPGPQPTVATLKDVRIKVSVPSNAVKDQLAKLTVSVTSKLNPDLKDTSEAATLKVGGPAPVPDQIGISVSSVTSPGRKTANDTIEIPAAAGAGKIVTVAFTVTPKKEGQHSIAAPTLSPNPGGIWSAAVFGTNPVLMAVPEDQFKIKITVPTANAATTNMTVAVSSVEDASVKGDRDIKVLIT